MSAAVLFYGYNLGAPEGAGWAVDGSGPGFESKWILRAEGEEGDYVRAMSLEILLASGVPEGEVGEPGAGDLLVQRCGVRILSLGHPNTPSYGLALADTIHCADDWTPKCIAPLPAHVGHQPLDVALEALGMKPSQLTPSWILAPEEF